MEVGREKEKAKGWRWGSVIAAKPDNLSSISQDPCGER